MSYYTHPDTLAIAHARSVALQTGFTENTRGYLRTYRKTYARAQDFGDGSLQRVLEGLDARIAELPAPPAFQTLLPPGCGYRGHEFGAALQDSLCVEGFLWDSEDSDEHGNLRPPERNIPCPQCNRGMFMQECIEESTGDGAEARRRGHGESKCPLRQPRPTHSRFSQPEREILAEAWEKGWRECQDAGGLVPGMEHGAQMPPDGRTEFSDMVARVARSIEGRNAEPFFSPKAVEGMTASLQLLKEISAGQSENTGEKDHHDATGEPKAKCAECGGRGKILRRVPAVAMAFPGNPEDWKWEDQTCWRCKGDGVARALGIFADSPDRQSTPPFSFPAPDPEKQFTDPTPPTKEP